MTATITVPDFPPAALRRAEDIVTGYATGRIKSTSLYFEFFAKPCPQLPPDIEDAVENACDAYRQWAKAVVGDTHWMTPDERRTLLDDAIRNLVAVLDARTTAPRKDVSA
ncbi:MAG: hypothetical protein JWN52_6613 [Actinomycetia bacterium]|nr:hypothetical protein [Actinomycetes bacterium]